jgi:hypothetical protein
MVSSHDGGSMWFMLAIGLWLYEDGQGQLEGYGEYRMGRMRVDCFHVWSSELVAPACVN